MHCGNYPAQREGKVWLCNVLLLWPGVKTGLFIGESESGNNGRQDVLHV